MAKIKVTQQATKERALKVFEILHRTYPDATCSLNYANPLQLLVATILAAQCTDERVNIVTKDLFRKYKKLEDYLAVPVEELQQDIRTCGFFRQKAKTIVNACRAVRDRFGGKVPGSMEELITLDGVGRKTANVLLAQCFGVPSIIVDTHCRRLSARLGFTRQTDPDKIEQDLMKVWPREVWSQFSHCIVFHGRSICQARAPKCSQCPVAQHCPFPTTAAGKKIAK